MKLLIVGDMHHRATVPRGRKDDYVRAHRWKMGQIYDIFVDHKCDVILAPGDVFDKSTCPHWLVEQFIRDSRTFPFLVILGQHDQRYHHVDRRNTPVGVLEAARAVRVLGKDPYVMDGVEFYGCSWSEAIPEPKRGPSCKVLLLHRMVIKKAKLWPAQEDFMYSKDLLSKHPFDLIVTGDNHKFFTDRYVAYKPPDGATKSFRLLVNCGSLMRTNVDQAGHKPSIVIYNTDTGEIEIIRLVVEPAEDVLRLDVAEQAKDRNKDLEAFVELVDGNRGAPDLDFLANLAAVVKSEGVSPEVAARVNDIVAMGEEKT